MESTSMSASGNASAAAGCTNSPTCPRAWQGQQHVDGTGDDVLGSGSMDASSSPEAPGELNRENKDETSDMVCERQAKGIPTHSPVRASQPH